MVILFSAKNDPVNTCSQYFWFNYFFSHKLYLSQKSACFDLVGIQITIWLAEKCMRFQNNWGLLFWTEAKTNDGVRGVRWPIDPNKNTHQNLHRSQGMKFRSKFMLRSKWSKCSFIASVYEWNLSCFGLHSTMKQTCNYLNCCCYFYQTPAINVIT